MTPRVRIPTTPTPTETAEPPLQSQSNTTSGLLATHADQNRKQAIIHLQFSSVSNIVTQDREISKDKAIRTPSKASPLSEQGVVAGGLWKDAGESSLCEVDIQDAGGG